MNKRKTSEKVTGRKKSVTQQYGCELLDEETKVVCNYITEMTALACQVPVAILTLVDTDSVWADFSFGTDIQTKIDFGFHEYIMHLDEPTEIADLKSDSRIKGLKTTKGEEIVFAACTPLRDKVGQIWGTLCIFDTQVRKLTTNQKRSFRLSSTHVLQVLDLRISKLNYESLIESSEDMIYEFDYEGKFVFANKITLKKTGYSREELEKMTCWDLMDPEYKETVKSHYLNQIKSGITSIASEFPIVTKSGNQIWLSQSIGCTVRKGRPIKIHAISRDISELIQTRAKLKKIEEQILAEKNLLKAMVASSPAAIAMFSKGFDYLAYSDKWNADKEVNEKLINERIIGVGNDCEENEDEALDSMVNRILEEEIVSEEHDLVVTKDGDERWIKWIAKPWKNTTDGSIGGIVIYTDDVTEIVNHKKELQEAKEEAEKLGKMKEDFLSSMSHEIRTPLNAIIGTTNLLMDENEELAEDEKFKLLKFSSNNLLALINNVLDFSKIESGKIHLEDQDFEMKELTNGLVNSWIPVAQQKDIELKLKLDETIPPVVKGDAVRLSQVLNNLINNAIKFTQEGMVHVKVQRKGDDGETIYFEVRDTGIGIPESKLDLVFESFEQVTTHQTFNSGGTGLGLPICKRLVNMMGSELSLSSKEGFGSIFSFTIPLKKGSCDGVIEGDYGSYQQDLDLSVLLVEDNQANQFIAKSFLEKWGSTVKIANNGKEAVELTKTKAFDIILMDMRMPVMDGFTAAKHIRSMQGDYFEQVPIIALTASTMLDMRKNVSASEFDGYLGKPFNPKELYGVLARYSKTVNTSNESVNIMVDNNEELETSPPEPDSDGLDLVERLNEYTEGDPTFLIEFSRNILNNLKMAEASIQDFFSKKKEVDLGELTHMIKPSLEIIGDVKLYKKLNAIRAKLPENFPSETTQKTTIKLMKEHMKNLEMIVESAPKSELIEQ